MGLGVFFAKMILQVSWCSSLLLLPLVTHHLSSLDEFASYYFSHIYDRYKIAGSQHPDSLCISFLSVYCWGWCWRSSFQATWQYVPLVCSFVTSWQIQNSWAKASNSSPALFLGQKSLEVLWAYFEGIILAPKRIVYIFIVYILYILSYTLLFCNISISMQYSDSYWTQWNVLTMFPLSMFVLYWSFLDPCPSGSFP